MMLRPFLGFLGLALIATLSVVGCGSGEKKGVKVTGSVVSGGAPQAAVTVGFIPVAVPDNTGSEAAITDAAGKFEATLLPGTYKVIVSKKVDQSGNVPGPDQDVGQLEADGQLKESMPAALTDPANTTLGTEVPAGGGELPPIEVPAAG